jgi:hypothetical protein
MACEIYERLRAEWNSAREEWAHFALPQNEMFRGTSVGQSKQMAREAKNKMNEVRKRMDWHKHGCAACNQQ